MSDNLSEYNESKDKVKVPNYVLFNKNSILRSYFLHGYIIPKKISENIKLILRSSENKHSLVPAANRIVNLNHNNPEYNEIKNDLEKLHEAVRGLNDSKFDEQTKENAKNEIEAAQRLWQSTELQFIQIKIGIILAIEKAGKLLKDTAHKAMSALVIDKVNAYIKILLNGEA